MPNLSHQIYLFHMSFHLSHRPSNLARWTLDTICSRNFSGVFQAPLAEVLIHFELSILYSTSLALRIPLRSCRLLQSLPCDDYMCLFALFVNPWLTSSASHSRSHLLLSSWWVPTHCIYWLSFQFHNSEITVMSEAWARFSISICWSAFKVHEIFLFLVVSVFPVLVTDVHLRGSQLQPCIKLVLTIRL